jgi:hypothetical protein
MIKFFRKIRYDLMEKNKTGKYLKYAIGEIILVVIGIVIALQLNEWRNENSNYKQKQNVLKALQFEFQSNLSQLDTILFYNNKILKGYPEAMGLIKSQDVSTKKEEFSESLKNLGYTWSFSAINGALRSGISSGDIHLVNNKLLIGLLFSWEDVVKDSEEESQKMRDYQSDASLLFETYIRVGNLWKSEFPGTQISKHPSDYSGLFKDVLFEDYVAISFFNATEYATELNVIKTNNLKILELIDKELLK